MISQFKRRVSKEIYGNQNYLNFIKKNHQLMQKEEFNADSYRRSERDSLSNHNSCTFNVKEESPPSREGKVIHDSLSKFKVANQHQMAFHLGTAHNTEHIEDHLYSETLKKNDQIAATLINSKMILNSKSKSTKHQAAKELLFHLNKNRSVNSKKVEMRRIEFDRYQSIQEPAVELNLKFPVIEKKNMATIDTQHDKTPFLDELRSRMKLIEKRQRTDRDDEVVVIKKEDEEENISRSGHLIKHVSGSKVRDQLYGLLPSFRSPNQLSDHKKKHKLHKNFKLKIEIAPDSQIREIVGQYLENNIVTRSMPISQKMIKQGKGKVIFNREILDGTVLEDKQELELIDNLKEDEMPTIQPLEKSDSIHEPNQSIQDHKPRAKKQAPAELKYEGDFTIYDLKIRSYRQFLFMVNLAHRIYDPILLKDTNGFKPEHRYKFYLGKGNNYLLVKSLLQRRFWWTVEEDPKKANFAWTQLKLNYFYQYQKKTTKTEKHFKLDKLFEPAPDAVKKKKKSKAIQQPKQPVKAGAFKAPLPPNDKKIFTLADKKYYDDFLEKAQNPEKLLKFSNRLRYFKEDFFRERVGDLYGERVHNHLEFNFFIGNKKALFYNLKQYYDLQNKNVFEIIPRTFHIKHGTSDPQYEVFRKEFSILAKEKLTKKTIKNVWIVKPGQLSNRGQGITVIDEIYELNSILKKKQKHFNGTEKTYIVQKYIEKPLLYKGRKFDIRHYMMISRLHGTMRAYWFGEGYIRTSSYQFNINDIGEEIIHLTNDAIQKYCDGYGKYEEGNKVSYNQFQRYMDGEGGKDSAKEAKFSFSDHIYPKMKAIALDAVKATFLQLDPNNMEHNFEIFGLDFMIDTNYDVWLIEVNTNPCLELSSKLLARLIPTMVEQSLRLTLDVIFPPPTHYPNSQKYLAPDNPLQRLQFELIFDEDRDGQEIEALFANAKRVDMGEVDEEDETYENDGKEIELDNDIE